MLVGSRGPYCAVNSHPKISGRPRAHSCWQTVRMHNLGGAKSRARGADHDFDRLRRPAGVAAAGHGQGREPCRGRTVSGQLGRRRRRICGGASWGRRAALGVGVRSVVRLEPHAAKQVKAHARGDGVLREVELDLNGPLTIWWRTLRPKRRTRTGSARLLAARGRPSHAAQVRGTADYQHLPYRKGI
jgi:hypothetical protein